MSRRASAARARVGGAAPVFAALGDATRLALVDRLCTEGPLTIVQLTDGVPVTRQAVTKHLHALVAAGLIRDRPLGPKQRVWEIQPRPLREASRYLDGISQHWDDALERLRAFVEE